MEGWQLTSFKITKTVTEKKPNSDQSLPNYQGELAISFTSYPSVDLTTNSIYFKAPEDFLRNQINSYGGKLSYQMTYSGYNLDGASKDPMPPDILMVGSGKLLISYIRIRIVCSADMFEIL